jgi:VIT1/CCC1 family predicted Fe2+/Mn2+ transporter
VVGVAFGQAREEVSRAGEVLARAGVEREAQRGLGVGGGALAAVGVARGEREREREE